MKRFVQFHLRFAPFILIGVILLGVAAGFYSTKLRFDSDFTALLPPSSPSVVDLDIVTEKAGGVGYLVLALEAKNPESSKRFAEMLVPELEMLPEVNYVEYKIDRDFFDARTLLYVDTEDLVKIKNIVAKKIETERKRLNPFYIELRDLPETKEELETIQNKYAKRKFTEYYFTSEDKYLVMLIKPNGLATDVAFCKKLIAETRATINRLRPRALDPDLRIHFTGRYYNMVEQTDALQRDIKRASVVAIVGMLLLILFYTRTFRSILPIFLPLGLGLLWTFAITTFLLQELNIITGFLIAILSGIGIDFGIHLFLRYQEERSKNETMEEALDKTVRGTGRPLFVSAITTAAAFATLTFSDFKGFSHFGLIAGIGILCVLAAMYLTVPSLFVVTHQLLGPRQYGPVQEKKALWGHARHPMAWMTLGGWVLFTIFSIWHIRDLEFEYDFRKIQGYETAALRLQEYISEDFGVSLTPTIIYAKPGEFANRIKDLVDDLKQDSLRTKGYTGINKTISLYSLVPTDQDKKIPVIREIGKLTEDKVFRFVRGEEKTIVEDLKRWVQVTPLTVDDIPPRARLAYEPAEKGDPGLFSYIYPGVDLWHGKRVMEYAEEMERLKQKIATVNGHEVRISGEASIFSEILTLVQKDGLFALLASLLAVLVFLLMDAKSIAGVFYMISPLLLGLVTLCGVMFVGGIKINFLNAVIFPTIVGLGIDYGVHIYHRYKEEGEGSVSYVVTHTGSAIILSALTTMIGFGSMMLTQHAGLRSVGLLAVIGIGACMLTSLTFSPPLFLLREENKKMRLSLKKQPKLVLLIVCLSTLLFSGRAKAEQVLEVTLEEALSRALKDNPTLAEAGHRIAKANATLQEAKNAVYPRIGSTSILTTIFEERGNALSSEEDLNDWGPWVMVNVMAVMPIYTWGKVSSYKEAAAHGVAVSEKERDMTQDKLAFEVKKYFYSVQYAAEMQDKLKNSEKKLSDIIDRVEGLLKKESGEVKKQDKYKLKYMMSELLKYKEMAISGGELTRLALAVSMGLSANHKVDTKTWELVKEKVTLLPMEDYLALTEKHRPEYVLLREGIAAKKALVSAERASYYPAFLLGAMFDFAWTNVRDDQGSPFAYDPYNRTVGGAGLIAKWDLDFWNTKVKIDKAKADKNEVISRQEVAIKGIPGQVRKAYRGIEEAEQRIKVGDEGKEFAKKWLMQAAFAFNFGLGDASEVKDAVEAKARAEESYYRGILDYNMALAELTLSMGKEVTTLKY